MLKRCTILLILLCLLPGAASAGGVLAGAGVADQYDLAMAAFYLEDYAGAASLFARAGNFQDAKKWGYYCSAINSVLSGGDLSGAQVRFELLAAQNFQQAADWAKYCKARAYEEQRIPSRASELYATILVHDSIERYLKCLNRSGALESAQSVRKRLSGVNLPVKDLYETGMAYYYLEEYASAADYFCLAGNYENARQWYCYCAAITLVTRSSLTDAQALFSLLDAQAFAPAAQWVTYCRAREYEQMHLNSSAVELYRTIFIYDSSERYLKLLGK